MACVAAPPSILSHSAPQRLQQSHYGLPFCANASGTFRNPSSRCHIIHHSSRHPSVVPVHDSLTRRLRMHSAEPFPNKQVTGSRPLIRPTAGRFRLLPVSSAAPQNANGSSPFFPYPSNSPAALRHLISSPGLARGPACYDALSAALVEQAGFPLTFISGEFS